MEGQTLVQPTLPRGITPGEGSTLREGSTADEHVDGSTLTETAQSSRGILGTLVGMPTMPKSPDGTLGAKVQGPPPRVGPPGKDATLEMSPIERPRPRARFETRPLGTPKELAQTMIRDDDGTEPVSAPIHLLTEPANSTRPTLQAPPVPVSTKLDQTDPVNLTEAEVRAMAADTPVEPSPSPTPSKPKAKPGIHTAPTQQMARIRPAQTPPPDAARVARPMTPEEQEKHREARARREAMDMTQQLPRIPESQKKPIDQRPLIMALAVVGAALCGALMYFVVE
ncbi:MAG: hypothetical protein ACE366_08665 [Bradymonadia bacterium]